MPASHRLEFEVLSGGRIIIDLDRCDECRTKICVQTCNGPGMGRVFGEKNGRPVLIKSLAEIKRGGCIECLGCELDCHDQGNKGLRIELDDFKHRL